jgi:serine/threonine protein phosphatase PrpC
MAGTNGYGITKTNQDSYIIKLDKNNNHEDEYTFGVFDGHGSEGHLVSQAIKQFFTNCSYFDFNTKSLIFQIFSSLSNIINNSQYFDSIGSGSTVVLVHINPEKIISINCGDSRAILITKNKNIISLTRDHKPELADERERIEASGGRIDKIYGMGPYRVWFKNEDYPGLAMSRSIGDKLAHKVGVSDVPEIKEFNISDVDPLAIVVASDGVWEFMSNEEVRNLVMNYAYSKDANLCAKTIVEKARVVWQGTGYAIDDITCVIGFFNE